VNSLSEEGGDKTNKHWIVQERVSQTGQTHIYKPLQRIEPLETKKLLCARWPDASDRDW
jgi:hypothetical protein